MKKLKICYVVILMLIFVGCGNDEKIENNQNETEIITFECEESDNYNCFYDSKHVLLNKSEENKKLNTNDKVFMDNCLVEKKYKVGDTDYIDYPYIQYNLDDGSESEFKLNSIDFVENYIGYNQNLNEYLVYNPYEFECSLYDLNGNLLKSTKMDNYNSDISGLRFCAWDSKYIYMYIDSLIVLDNELNVIYDDNAEKQYGDLYCIADNSYKQSIFMDDQENIYTFNGKNSFEKKDNYVIPKQEFVFDYYDGDEKYDFYFVWIEENNVYLIGCNDGKTEKILNFDDFDLGKGFILFDENDSALDIVKRNESYILYERATSNYEFVYLEPTNDKISNKEAVDKKELVIAGNIENLQSINKYINGFNYFSENYKIVYKDYSEYGENAEVKLYNDITKGNEIDALLFDGFYYEGYQNKKAYIDNELFIDLNEYFEASEKVSKSDFLDNVISSMEIDDGKIFTIFPHYSLFSFICTDKYKINDLPLLEESAKTNPIFTNYEMDPLYSYLEYSNDRYINTDLKKLDNKDELRKVIELLVNQYKYVDEENITEWRGLLNNGRGIFHEDIFMDYSEITSLCDISKGNIVYSTYEGEYPAIIPCDVEIGVLINSNNKDGMFDFLDYMFSEETYGRNKDITEYFPVLKSSFEQDKEDIKSRMTENMEATEIEKRIDFLDGFIKNARIIPECNDECLTVITDEAYNYYKGNQNIEKTMSNIENKVNDILRDIDS